VIQRGQADRLLLVQPHEHLQPGQVALFAAGDGLALVHSATFFNLPLSF